MGVENSDINHSAFQGYSYIFKQKYETSVGLKIAC